MGLPKRFSNKRPALRLLISRVLKGSERRGPRNRTPTRHDSRGAVAKNPAKSQTRLTPERRAELVTDYEAGIPVKVMSAKYRMHRGSIPKFVLAGGGTLRSRGISETARARALALALYDEGFTLQDVAARVDADEKTVRGAIVELGGTTRTRGRRTGIKA